MLLFSGRVIHEARRPIQILTKKETCRLGGGESHALQQVARRDGHCRERRTAARRTHPGGSGKNAGSPRDQGKKRTGIDSDTDLIEVALANIAVADDYADWLLSRRGTVGSEAELEF